MTTFKLYYTPTSCGAASFLAASIGGLQFDSEVVDLPTHKTKSGTDFYTINPKGNVPTVVLPDGSILFANLLDEGMELELMLLDDIVEDSRWDITYLGMQIMVEGLALAAFGFLHALTTEPLLKQLLRYVMSDEARHVAFGVLSLKEYYAELSDAEMLERQEFAFEAAVRMRDRFMQQEVWERMGLKPKEVLPLLIDNPNRLLFQQMLFTKIVPNCKKLGLLDAGDGWLRTKFQELGVIQFEDLTDTSDEYEAFALGDYEWVLAFEAPELHRIVDLMRDLRATEA